ncbi:transmembrane and tpr repeat-containing protein 1-like [Dermatophagoides farinae]|uniref:dolichyl-phosphate-mannose--protein mannosyltransferase n=1 Tax=Dermatophagoides farinae TaxID=6954 RepID=A0A9D4NWN5_DERFA|nr:transmembrane and tpr repeat-containing protein 1-like [Dermatophagoides farinae]
MPIIGKWKNFKFFNNFQSSSTSSSLTILTYSIVAIISIVCFINSLNGDFVHDDIPAIVKNGDVHGTTTIWQLFNNDFWGRPMSDVESHKSYRPITTFTFRLNMMISTHPFGFHMVNLFLHTMVSLLVCMVGQLIMDFDIHLTAIAGLLFAIHPIHCEAIASIVGRADLLCALFYLLAFVSFHLSLPPLPLIHHHHHHLRHYHQHQHHQSSSLWLLPFVLLTTMALLSKEIGITILGVCALYWLCYTFIIIQNDCLPLMNIIYNQRLMAPIITIIMSFLTLMTIRLRMLGNSWPLFTEQDNPASHSRSMLTRILTYCYISAYNIRLLLSPTHQSYDWQTSTIRLIQSFDDQRNIWTLAIMAMFTLLLYRSINKLLLLLLLLRNKSTNDQLGEIVTGNGKISRNIRNNIDDNDDDDGRTLFISIIMTIIPYLPASNLFITVGFVIAERLLYVPSIGFIFVICYGIRQLRRQYNHYGHIIYSITIILMAIFTVKTLQQNHVWTSRETLYKSGIVNVPENAKAHYNYGNLQQDLGNWNDAIYHYQTAIRLWPDHASAHNNLGALYWKISSPDKAEQHFQQALNINPYHAKAHFNLAKVFSKRGQTNEAIALMERSICLDRKFAESYEALAALYAHKGHELIAERFYWRAIRLRRRNADFYNNYGAFLQRTGRLASAERNYGHAIKLKPEHQIAIINMANLLTLLKRFDRAEYFYKRAMKLRQDATTLDSLGTLYLRRSKLQLARRVYHQLLYKSSSSLSLLSSQLNNDNHSVEIHHHHHHTTTIPEQLTIINHNSRPQMQSNMASIHYAQLLILEEQFDQAQVILETLITMASTMTMNNKSQQQQQQQQRRQQKHLQNPTESIAEFNFISNVNNDNDHNDQLFRLDLHHQLALLFTMTNRSEKALESIMKALDHCPIHSGSIGYPKTTTIMKRCSQIWTLKGDIQKDLHLWSLAIYSYEMAIKLDECQPRAHLHLAVIYHFGGQFDNAMFHYARARQLDQHSSNLALIDDNIRKLRRFRLKHNNNNNGDDDKEFNKQLQCQWQRHQQRTITSSSMINTYHSSNLQKSIADNGNQSNDHQWYMMATEPPDIIHGPSSSTSTTSENHHNLLSLSSSSY